MQIEQRQWTESGGWCVVRACASLDSPQLVLVFGSRDALQRPHVLDDLRERYGAAHLVGCSTAGEICGTAVHNETVVATAIQFEHTAVRAAWYAVDDPAESEAAGEALAASLNAPGLTHVFILSEGLRIHGSHLIRGLSRNLPPGVGITGGMAGDGLAFVQTLVTLDGAVRDGMVAAVGFYGDRLSIGYASVGGWKIFGPDRLVTRSEGNVLFELDNQPALDLYKNYIGPHAATLPTSGAMFPLALRTEYEDVGLVRTLMLVDEAAGSMTFAGDIPQGSYTRLMKTNTEHLIDAAADAASAALEMGGGAAPELALLVSCAGRKMILEQRTAEEVDTVHEILGAGTVLAGFYAYGEISPFTSSARCELHNQTMTLTTLSER